MVHELKKILVINLGGIGDLLLSSGALRSIRTRYRDSQIDLLAVKRCGDFMEHYGIFDSIHTFPASYPFYLIRLLLRLRKERYDIVVNMRTIVSWASAIKMFLLFAAINGKQAAGRDTDRKGFFFDIKIKETYRAGQLEYLYDACLAEKLGAVSCADDIFLPVNPGDKTAVDALLARHGATEHCFLIGINPGGQPSRRWPLPYMRRLAESLLSCPECVIVLTGSSSEKDFCRAVSEGMDTRRLIDFSGLLTVMQLAALMQKFRLFISNDTGPMHMCVCMNTPGVFLFGGGNQNRYAPFKNTALYTLLQGYADCSPCEKRTCRSMKCMTSIPVETVLSAVTELRKRLYA